jgi:hypothetical protein
MANDSLTRGNIIGDVLDPFTSSVPLTVMYDGRPVFDGMEFRASALSVKPRVEIGGDDFRVAYTLVSHHFADRVHWWWPYIWPSCRLLFSIIQGLHQTMQGATFQTPANVVWTDGLAPGEG